MGAVAIRDGERPESQETRPWSFVAAAFPTLVQGSLWSPVTVPTVCAMPSHHRTVLARLSHSPKDFTTMYRQSTTLSARTCTIFTRQWHTHSGSLNKTKDRRYRVLQASMRLLVGYATCDGPPDVEPTPKYCLANDITGIASGADSGGAGAWS